MTTTPLTRDPNGVLRGIRARFDRLDRALAAGEVTRDEFDRGAADCMAQLHAVLRDSLAEADRRGMTGPNIDEGWATLAAYEAAQR